MFNGKTLMITGGTGSFGNVVLKRFLETDIKEIRILSRDEKKQDDMRHEYNNSKLKFYIGDVRNSKSLTYAMRGVDYLFHAAALKQVPSCEFFPLEAVYTNILGVDNVLTVAIEEGVKKAVCLSTDKAAYPINAMGMSKALMEKVIAAKARNSTETSICCTRYGNIMASRGSVIPLFIEQIKAGKPISVTSPEMTRFMMSLDDAVDLVLFAFEHCKPGDLMINKAPAASILTLASALRSIFNADCDIKIIGTRHGEKQHETLVTREEMAKAIDMGDYYRIPADSRDLNYELQESGSKAITHADEFTSENTTRLDENGLIELLKTNDYIKGELLGRDMEPV